MISAIIVDDEIYSRRNLDKLVRRYCSSINVLGLTDSVTGASEMIQSFSPDVVFLDINMPEQDGFDLLRYRKNWIKDPAIVFVTAYEQFALKALKNDALDYLMKPIDIDELQACQSKILKRVLKNQNTTNDEFSIDNNKIVINDSKSIRLIKFEDIIYIESHGSYSLIHYYYNDSLNKCFITMSLKDIEELLSKSGFFRIHNSSIVNISRVNFYDKKGTGTVIMDNGIHISASRRKSALFKEYIFKHFNHLY